MLANILSSIAAFGGLVGITCYWSQVPPPGDRSAAGLRWLHLLLAAGRHHGCLPLCGAGLHVVRDQGHLSRGGAAQHGQQSRQEVTLLQVGMLSGALLLLIIGLYEHQLEEFLGAQSHNHSY